MPLVTVTWEASHDVDGTPPKGALTFRARGSSLVDRVPLVNGALSTTLEAGETYEVAELIPGRVPASGTPLSLSDYHVEPGQPVLQTITREEFDALLGLVQNINLGASSYRVYTFLTPAATWSCPHDLGRAPLVSVLDSAGQAMLADIDQPTNSLVTVTFAVPTSGRVILI
jgi:hypothetical protein